MRRPSCPATARNSALWTGTLGVRTVAPSRFMPAIDERSGHVRHRFHCVNIGGNARDFLLYQVEVAERFLELLSRICVLDRELQAMLGRARATGTESGAPEIQHGKR